MSLKGQTSQAAHLYFPCMGFVAASHPGPRPPVLLPCSTPPCCRYNSRLKRQIHSLKVFGLLSSFPVSYLPQV